MTVLRPETLAAPVDVGPAGSVVAVKRRKKRRWIGPLVALIGVAALLTGVYLRLYDRQALPFDGLNTPGAVVVDAAGTVYVADTGNNRVVKLVAGSTEL